ncbi:CRISPR-associated ring nuclease Csm6 [Leucothrix pacifica]|uniref:TIGR02584 family CRISPR-associated protein n=1 Tax=Leucothrix pacifica TaxID=1247513 RepID=A0A317CMX0_9GAMM|nr:CRISPR-associated ring nuclease Csm6 [Leucothrix pacifica]PWQ97652.1 TIGR02584 family CRISPR-associated protein [Leucothrix pacifica]
MNPLKLSKPNQYPRRILLAVAARSPQIVTETIYALTQLDDDACMPTEVHIITTKKGQPFVEKLLPSDSSPGWIGALCKDYQLPVPSCESTHIHLIADANGVALEDVRTRDDNTHAADFITRVVQELTADADSSLYVSLSGGRRTMTFYIGYALSLFGRPQDRLSHVLVEDEYFFNEEFFYPPPKETWVVRPDNTGFDASKVEVTLADIPFVRLREGLPSRLLSGQTSFSDTVDAAQAEFAPVQVGFDVTSLQLSCSGKSVKMNAVELSFYVMLLQRAARSAPPIRWTDAKLADEFLAVYRDLHGESGAYERARKTLTNGMTKEYFEQRKSRVNSQLRKALGKRVAQSYLIDSHGKRPNTRFGLTLPDAAISLT